MATKPLCTIGIAMPDDFPISSFEAIHERVVPWRGRFPEAVNQYFGAENGVAYRFRACAEYSDGFSVAGGSSSEGRHIQEKCLFGFFVSGFAVIESFCYGAFMLGAIIEPPAFPIATDGDLRRIDPAAAASSFAKSKLSSEPIHSALAGMVDCRAFKEWKVVRNLLSHRVTPGRDINLGGPEPPSVWKAAQGIELTSTTTSERRAWLAKELTSAMAALERVALKHL